MTMNQAGHRWPIVGHGASIDRLRMLAAKSRVPTAFIFAGPRAVGRHATAREFARTLLCPNAADGAACGVCSSCNRVTSRNHPDLDVWNVDRQEWGKPVSRSGSLTIETVREIVASAALRPYESRRRVVIVDDAETLGEDAQQALLKTLEDAAEYVTIILITTSIAAIIATVRSRAVEIPFQLATTAQIAAGLRWLRPDGESLDEAAQLAQGRTGRAITMISEPDKLEEEREENAAIERWIAASKRDRLVEAYRRGEALVQKRVQPQAVQHSLDRAVLVWRDLLLDANGNGELGFDSARASRLNPASRMDTRDLYEALASCRQCQFDLSHNVRPRLALELMVNRWPILL